MIMTGSAYEEEKGIRNIAGKKNQIKTLVVK
jgi:hypothetical protein